MTLATQLLQFVGRFGDELLLAPQAGWQSQWNSSTIVNSAHWKRSVNVALSSL